MVFIIGICCIQYFINYCHIIMVQILKIKTITAFQWNIELKSLLFVGI